MLGRRALGAALLAAPLLAPRGARGQAAVQGAAAGYRGIYACGAPLLDERRLLPDAAFQGRDAGGVYIRCIWSQLEPRQGQYDFGLLDREVQRAVAAGKRISLSVIAGAFAPPWLAAAGIRTLGFSIGRGGVNRSCIQVQMGVPWDPGFVAAFLAMQAALVEHLRRLPGAMQALRIVKLTGVNRLTEELRIPAATPDRTDVCGAVDEAGQWLALGYKPGLVVEAWTRMAEGLAERFPGKLLALDLLERNDFPAVDDAGRPSVDPVKPRVINEAERRFPGRFAVQWNGLGVATPLAETVLAAARRGTVIGWQSNLFLGREGSAGCNLRRGEAPQPCDTEGYDAILRRGLEAGAAYLELWTPDVVKFAAPVRQAEQALAAGLPRPR